ncbi:MAG: response regulator [Armatimonadetes bacterium]|nr:response regulator [Anaerolineae bacterium]
MARILLLDDNLDLLTLVVDMLEMDDHQVTIAINGKEGLTKLDQATTIPDLILTDIKMPEMGGWEFLATIKQNPRFAAIPCVVFSGDEFDHEVAFERGAVACLVKPLRYKQVAQTIAQFV